MGGVHEDLIILGNHHPFPHYLSNELLDHVPLREGYQSDDYQVGIISYDSNIMKNQLFLFIHPHIQACHPGLPFQGAVFTGCCVYRVLIYTVMTSTSG